MKHLRTDAISLALIGLASAITGSVYARLPAQVPVHFNLYGKADGFMSKPFGAWILIATAVLVWLLVRFGAWLLPRRARERMQASPVALVGVLTIALFTGLQLLILLAALNGSNAIGRSFAIVFGLYWIVLAQVLPRVRRNPFIGIRTAWTLSSDENWARTHRFGAWAFTIGGLIAVVAGVFAMPALAIVAILCSALAPVVWSLIVAHRLPPA
jgi:uncharacterized membrane protein